jgi:hypothetical protein
MTKHYQFVVNSDLDREKCVLTLTHFQMIQLRDGINQKIEDEYKRMTDPTPSPGYVDCEIREEKGRRVFELPIGTGQHSIDYCCVFSNFIGYVIEGEVWSVPVIYGDPEFPDRRATQLLRECIGIPRAFIPIRATHVRFAVK